MNTRIPPLVAIFLFLPGTALAAPRTATLDVQNMTCAVCPLTVKKALENVSGVQQVTVDSASKTATVHFDDAVASSDQLTEATRDAGYPSTVKVEK